MAWRLPFLFSGRTQGEQEKLPEQRELECSEKHIYNGTLPGLAFLEIVMQKKH